MPPRPTISSRSEPDLHTLISTLYPSTQSFSMMLGPQPFTPTWRCNTILMIGSQEPLDRAHLFLHRLHLVGPRPYPNICLDPDDPLLVQHCVRLTDECHHVGP